jgi:hypothetical protein
MATMLMIAASWVVCAAPLWLGWMESSVSRVAFFIPIAGLSVPFFIGWMTARRTRHPDPSTSASGVSMGVLGFCLGIGLQDAMLNAAPSAFVIMMGVGGVLGLVAGLSALVGHGTALDQESRDADEARFRQASLPRARIARSYQRHARP